jgi:hypothetical protein
MWIEAITLIDTTDFDCGSHICFFLVMAFDYLPNTGASQSKGVRREAPNGMDLLFHQRGFALYSKHENLPM